MPDRFDASIADSFGLQDKTDEIIIKGRGAKGAGDHRSNEARYERLLALSFGEARCVLKQNGQLTIILGTPIPKRGSVYSRRSRTPASLWRAHGRPERSARTPVWQPFR